MRRSIRLFVKVVAETLPIREPVVEFGSFQVPGQEDIANLRPLFPGKEYVGSDMRQGPGVERILDLHAIDLPSNSVGTALTMDTLEHLESPHTALQEAYRVLQPSGMIVISSVMNFPVHDYPCDYWRFTPEGFKSLLKPFSGCYVEYLGKRDFPHTLVGVGFKAVSPPRGALHGRVRRMEEKVGSSRAAEGDGKAVRATDRSMHVSQHSAGDTVVTGGFVPRA